MRWLIKLSIKLSIFGAMLLMVAGGLWYARPYIMKAAGIPVVEGAPGIQDAHFSSDETGLMATVLKSALQLFSGSKSRNELANGLSDKIYEGRDQHQDSELGIEFVKKPVAGSSAPNGGNGAANAQPGTGSPANQRAPRADRLPRTGPGAQPGGNQPDLLSGDGRAALTQLWAKAKVNVVGLALVFVLLIVLFVVFRRRRRRAQLEAFVPPALAIQDPTDSDPLEMKHAVHSLKSEEFELLVALIFQRQGYRISLPAGLGGERGNDFTIARKAERVLVQCRRLSLEQKVPVDRVRELHEAVVAAGATRGIFVASCGFSWDARHFGKAKGVRLINARTLDALLTAARENPDEDLLTVSQWAPKFFSKVELTTPNCPACGAKMDQLPASDGSVWVCSQRPECRGRRSTRKHQKPAPPPARKTNLHTDEVTA